MRRAALIALALLAAIPAGAAAAGPRKGELVVVAKPGLSAATAVARLRAAGATRARALQMPDFYFVRGGRGLAGRLARLAWVRSVEPNRALRASEVPLPNDDQFSQQWGMHNTGQLHRQLHPTQGHEIEQGSGTPDIDIDAPEAWQRLAAVGVARPAVIAIADTGIDFAHPDLDDNLWVNPAEECAPPHPDACHDGVDSPDDAGTVADDVHGYDSFNGDGDPRDDAGHGTHVAGIAGAETGNGIGVAGVAGGPGQADLMAIKLMNSGGYSSTAVALDGWGYALQMRPDVINNSWGGDTWDPAWHSPAFAEALNRLSEAGVVSIFSAGNNPVLRAEPPGVLGGPGTLRIANHNHNDRLVFSHYGAGVELAAPGEDILSTGMGGDYQLKSGTSMASPMVAGAAGLIRAAYPQLKADQVTQAIVLSVDPSPTQVADPFGWTETRGRLNADSALRLAGSL